MSCEKDSIQILCELLSEKEERLKELHKEIQRLLTKLAIARSKYDALKSKQEKEGL